MAEHRQISPAGVSEIKQREGLVLVAEPDQAGVWTIGYGHTGKVFPGDTITQTQAEQFLREDVRWAETTISANVKVPLSQSQFDALVSWSFNVGIHNTIESTLVRRLNAGDYGAVSSELMRWVKITDPNTGTLVFNQGLQNRRMSEAEQFTKDDKQAPIAQARGAAIAAAPAGREDMAGSRTLKGAALAGGGGVATAIVDATSQAKWQLEGMVYFIPALKWVLIGVIVIGAAAAIYARFDDHKKCLK